MDESLSFRIRVAEPEDAEPIARVHMASWRETYRHLLPAEFFDEFFDQQLDHRVESRVARLLRPEVRNFVATTPGDRVVGFIDGGPNRVGRTCYPKELYALYLLKGWQRRGIGRALVQALVDAFVLEEAYGMEVWVLKDNSARRFYERLGGTYLKTTSITIGATILDECAYGWDDIRLLL